MDSSPGWPWRGVPHAAGAGHLEDEVEVSITGAENGLVTSVERFLQSCDGRWPADQGRPAVVARAPGRLDCMGGMADFSGTLALQMPLDRAVYVAAGRRDDQKIHVASSGWARDGEPAVFEWPLSAFYQSDGQIVTGADLARRLEACPWARHIAGVCLALLESGEVPHFGGGVTLVLQSDIPVNAGLASSAAIQVATAQALCALFDVELSPRQLAAACRAADTEVVGHQPGLVDHLTCLLGEAGTLLEVRCQPDDVLGTLSLPDDVCIAAVDAGIRLPIYAQRYADNRAAALIGRYLIEQILRSSGEVGDPTGGYLANISPDDYVRRFRNELPVKLKGRDFIDYFGRPDELEVDVQPDQIYKVRSRTEHHIYENDRAHRFMERLARARRTGERDALIEAGELMYASHWSYGQRCGMGSIETDQLVNRIRERGPVQGLYGAKVTAGGCGGSVAVLLADTPAAHAALKEACAAYADRTGRAPTLLIGSSDGAATFGVRRIE